MKACDLFVAFVEIDRDVAAEVVASGKEDLRDMDFQSKPDFSYSGFRYEEQMLKDWFKHQQRKDVFPTRDK